MRDEGSQGREQDWKNHATLLLISQLVTHIVPNNMFCSEHNLLWAFPLCFAFTCDNSAQYKQARESVTALYASPHLQVCICKVSLPMCPLQRKPLWTILKFNEPYTTGALRGFILCMHMFQGERWDSSVIAKISTAQCFFTHMHIHFHTHTPGQAL